MPTYKYAPVQDSESGVGASESSGIGAKSFDGDPFAKKRDMCVGL